MDLRIVKTRKAIHAAFLAIRKTTPLERVKVRDICERALINKSTFYAHYQDIYSLSQEMENEAIDHFFQEFKEKDLLFVNPESFLRGFQQALSVEYDLFAIVFGNRFETLFPKIERRIKQQYASPGLTLHEEVTLTFLTFGLLRTVGEFKQRGVTDEDELISEVASIVKRITSEGTEHPFQIPPGPSVPKAQQTQA